MNAFLSKEIRIILLSAVLLRAVVFLCLNPWSPDGFSTFSLTGDKDEQEYHQLALNLLAYGEYSSDFDDNISSYEQLDARRPPAYPAFLAIVYLLFGVSPIIAVFVQGLLSLFIPVITYRIAQHIWNTKTAFIAGILASIEPTTLMYSFRLLPDIFFVIGLLFGLELLISSKGWKKMGLSGIVVGITCLFKPAAMFLMIALTPLLVWHDRKKKPIAVLLPLCAQLLVMSFWMFRNFMVYGYFAFSSIGGVNLYYYNAAITEANKTGKTQSEIVQEWEGSLENVESEKFKNPFFRARVYQSKGVDYLLAFPIESIKTWVLGSIGFFTHMGSADAAQLLGISPLQIEAHQSALLLGNEDIKNQISQKNLGEKSLMIIFFIITLVIYLLAMKGAFAVKWSKLSLQVFLGVAVYFVIITGSVGNARYRLPAMPTLLLLAAFGIPGKRSGDIAELKHI